MLQELLVGTVTDENGLLIEVYATETDGGTTFRIEVVEGYADLRGFFFDYGSGDLSVLDAGEALDQTGAQLDVAITANEMGTSGGGDITKVGTNDNNLNGTKELDGTKASFDAGLMFGTSGAGENDIGSVTFTIEGLTLENIDELAFGIRATSVGETEEERSDSVKLISEFDVPPPEVTSVEVSDPPITDEDVAGTFSVTVKFDQPMDGTLNPMLAFDQDVAGTLTPTATIAGMWTDNHTYVATYDISDANTEINNIKIDVSGAQNTSGTGQVDYTPEIEFDIDTKNPTVTVDIVDGALNDGDSSLVMFEFNENVLDFLENDVTVANGTLSDFAGSGSTYTATFTAQTSPGGFETRGFESGNFQDWQTLGNTLVTSAYNVFDGGPTTTAIEGSYFAVMNSTGVTEDSLELFLNVGSNAIDSITNGNPTNGSVIKTTLDVEAGDTIAFNWYFDAGDYDPFYDNSFFTTLDGQLTQLADVGDVGNYGDSGWQTAMVTATTTGTVEFGFGVVNEGDSGVSSALYIDNLYIDNLTSIGEVSVTGAYTDEVGNLGTGGSDTVDITTQPPPIIHDLHEGDDGTFTGVAGITDIFVFDMSVEGGHGGSGDNADHYLADVQAGNNTNWVDEEITILNFDINEDYIVFTNVDPNAQGLAYPVTEFDDFFLVDQTYLANPGTTYDRHSQANWDGGTAEYFRQLITTTETNGEDLDPLLHDEDGMIFVEQALFENGPDLPAEYSVRDDIDVYADLAATIDAAGLTDINTTAYVTTSVLDQTAAVLYYEGDIVV